jgi:iron complex outermembrane receptor protein
MKRFVFIMALACLFGYARAQWSLSGIVSDDSGEEIIGANVLINGTYKGTATNLDGKFEFKNLKEGPYTLTISFIGYETIQKQIIVTQNTTLDFSLKQTAIMADEVIIRGTRAADREPITRTNITKSSYEKQSLGQDLPILLSQLPSIVTTSDAGAGVGYTGIRVRGTDASRTNVTINNIPMNDAESQGVFWVDIPDMAENIQTIQIQRGVGTSSNGSGAFGASMNLQTTGYNKDAYAEIKSSAGSFNTFKNTVGVGSGLISNGFTFDARASIIKTDGFIDRASSDLKSYFISGGYYSDKDIIKINMFGGTEKTYQAWNGIPKVKLENDTAGIRKYIEDNWLSEKDAENLINSDPRTYNSFTYHNQTDNYEQNHYQLLYSRKISNSFSANIAFHYTRGLGYYEEYKEYQDFSKYGLNNVIVGNDTITSTNLVRRLWLDNDFYGSTYSLTYSKGKTEITFGGGMNEYYGRHYGNIIWAEHASNSDNDDKWYKGYGLKDDLSNFIKASVQVTNNMNVYADLQYRHIFYSIKGTDKIFRNIEQKHSFDFINPKAGLNYKINENQNVYFSYGISQKEPTRANYVDRKPGTPEPKAEKLFNYELGYKIRMDKFYSGINLYYMDYKDQLVLTGELNDVGDPMMMNVKSSYRSGIELEWAYQITPKLKWEANTTLSQNKIKNYVSYIGVFTDDDIISIAEDTLNTTNIAFSPNIIFGSNITITPLKQASIIFQTKYVGSQYIDNTSSDERKLDAYCVNNLVLTYSIPLKTDKDLSFSLLINNIFNTEYITNAWVYRYMYGDTQYVSDGYFPQAGINFMAGMSLRF